MAIRLSVCLIVVALFGQQLLEFDVASVKPNKTDANGQSMRSNRGTLRIVNMELSTLIENAYYIKSSQLIGLPPWAESEAFDIDAKAEEEPSVPISEEQGRNQVRLQSLLASRFHLRIHRETKLLPSYVLKTGKQGSKLKPSEAGAAYSTRVGRGSMSCTRCAILVLTSSLSSWLERLVFDETGLVGNYDIGLAFEPVGQVTDGKLPSLATALEEQLGLILESKKMPVELLVVDHVERPSSN